MSKHEEHKAEHHTAKAAVLDPCFAAIVDAYALGHEGRQMLESRGGTARTTGDVKGALSDLLAKLIEMGKTVDWQVVIANLWTLIGKLYSGGSVADIIAWLVTLFPSSTPTVP